MVLLMVFVDHGVFEKGDIINIHKYLMKKDNIKQCLNSLNKTLLHFFPSLVTKRLSLKNESCVARPTFIDLNPNELQYVHLWLI